MAVAQDAIVLELPPSIRKRVYAFGEDGEHKLHAEDAILLLARKGGINPCLYIQALLERTFEWAYARYYSEASKNRRQIIRDVAEFKQGGDLPYYVKRVALALLRQEITILR